MDDGASLPSWPRVLSRLVAGADLTTDEAVWAMDEVMAGRATHAQVAGLLVGLRAKGETVQEVAALSASMLASAVPLALPEELRARAVDLVGTGGDRAGTVNISTTAALVVAGAGVAVVKHGNRAASSVCGSADLLEALGVRLDLPAARVAEVAAEVGLTFCFAPLFHPAMRHAAAPRRELGVPTAFNLLGPLTNPGRPGSSAMGVADRAMAPLIAGVLAGRGTRALVFRGDDGLDELTTTGPSTVWEVRGGTVRTVRVEPGQVGLAEATVADLRGGDAAVNAAAARAVLAGERGPVRDAVLLGAAAGLVAADPDPGAAPLAERLTAAVARSAEAVDTGAAAAVLERWVAATTA
jgi:anthranilate phosphoribosyltransferase